jgi:hypothetical protein
MNKNTDASVKVVFVHFHAFELFEQNISGK